MRRRTVGELRGDAKVLVPHVALQQVYTVHTSFRVHDRNQQTPFRSATELRVNGVRNGDRVESHSRYETTARSDTENPVDVWTAVVECVAVFRLDDPDLQISDEELEAFALLVGMPALHPYAREWTQTLTSQSQYPAFTLGLLNSPAELDDEHMIELPDREERIAP